MKRLFIIMLFTVLLGTVSVMTTGCAPKYTKLDLLNDQIKIMGGDESYWDDFYDSTFPQCARYYCAEMGHTAEFKFAMYVGTMAAEAEDNSGIGQMWCVTTTKYGAKLPMSLKNETWHDDGTFTARGEGENYTFYKVHPDYMYITIDKQVQYYYRIRG